MTLSSCVAGHRRAALFRLSVAALLVMQLSGCGIYVHDSDLAKTTKSTHENFAELDFSAPFKEQQVRLKEFADREDLAVANVAVANRDKVLAGLILPSPLENTGQNAHARFAEVVETDCNIVYGSCKVSAATLGNFVAAPELIRAKRDALRVAKERYASAVLDFSNLRSKDDKRKTDCKTLTPSTGGTSEADKAYDRIGDLCKRMQDIVVDPAKLIPGFNPSDSSAIRAILADIAQHEAALAAAKAEATELSNKIKDINAEIEAANGTEDKTIEDLIAEAKTAIGSAGPVAKLAGLEELEATLEGALSTALKAPAGAGSAGDSAETTKAGTAVSFLISVAAASQRYTEASRSGRVGMLVLALAALKQQKDMAQVDAELMQSNLSLDDQKLLAAMNWLAALAETKLLIDTVGYGHPTLADVRRDGTRKQREAMGESVKAYVLSWDTGRVPYRILNRKGIQLERTANAKRAELTARNFHATLEPVLADLEAYGEGGIRPETIAQVLGHLGIMAAILGG